MRLDPLERGLRELSIKCSRAKNEGRMQIRRPFEISSVAGGRIGFQHLEDLNLILCCSSMIKPSNIDPSGKTEILVARSETVGTKESDANSNPNAEEEARKTSGAADNKPPTGNQSAGANTGSNQEPLAENQSGGENHDDQIPSFQEKTSSPPPAQEEKTTDPELSGGPHHFHADIITGYF
uniref:OSJNBb0115I09.12 protein n=1 Tax=Oryza sativa subsp. japonica TaxID=39947 RepID=Q7XLA0_ORYSJ|nr:OSJNBb0115I09.12 [Oryza sativa Japonica Group]